MTFDDIMKGLAKTQFAGGEGLEYLDRVNKALLSQLSTPTIIQPLPNQAMKGFNMRAEMGKLTED